MSDESCPLCLAGRKHPDTAEAHAYERTVADVNREQWEDFEHDRKRGEYSRGPEDDDG